MGSWWVCVLEAVCSCASVHAYVCYSCDSDSWQQVCVLLCGGSGVRLTRGVEGVMRGGSGGGWQPNARPWAPQTPHHWGGGFNSACVCVYMWVGGCVQERPRKWVHTHTHMCVSKHSDSADPAASTQLPFLASLFLLLPHFSLLRSPALYGRARRSPSQLLNLILSWREAGIRE